MVAAFVGTRPRTWWEINGAPHWYMRNIPTLVTFIQSFHWYTHDRIDTNKSMRWPRAWKSDPLWGGRFEVLTPVVALLYMCVKTGLGAHLASCTMGIGSLSRGLSGQCFGRWPPHPVTCYLIDFISADMNRECGNIKFVHSIKSLHSTGTVQMTVSKYAKIAKGSVAVGVCGLGLLTQSIWKHK
jgi:hypothetical protein